MDFSFARWKLPLAQLVGFGVVLHFSFRILEYFGSASFPIGHLVAGEVIHHGDKSGSLVPLMRMGCLKLIDF